MGISKLLSKNTQSKENDIDFMGISIIIKAIWYKLKNKYFT